MRAFNPMRCVTLNGQILRRGVPLLDVTRGHERYEKRCILGIAIIFMKIARSLRLRPPKRGFVYQFWLDVGYS